MIKRKYSINKCECGEFKDNRSKQCYICSRKKPDHKKCNGCNNIFPIEEFSTRIKRGATTYRSRCKKCEAATARAYNKVRDKAVKKAIIKRYTDKNPQAVKKWSIRKMFKRIGCDPNLGEKLFNEHSKLCDICGKANKNGHALAIDHDHVSGKFRGFLCSHCNNGLGQFRDSIPDMIKAINYLQMAPVKQRQLGI